MKKFFLTILLLTFTLTSNGCVNPSMEDGLERLTACVTKYGHMGDSLKIFEAVSKDVTAFVGETIQNDDMTLICMRLTDLDFQSDREQTMLVTNWS